MIPELLTPTQVKSVLTTADLKNIENKIEAGELNAQVVNGEAIIVYKKNAMRLFDVMELIGSL